ncbi:hypothetical protein F5B22DRAFT_131506 [Xylaria bambusicola]|uniref:uncharacterized protein n=1 Tax=Xylaria bambusicola TaxID=326684 RepID=UPI002007C2AB|nr:uncharacterized protein F5B22DRAFT_131506 [Xylaria bambusicola]KAI0517171.1 hypothetical protein F5B22DRAFT_131506 [Xylaria bambusicola]
MASKETSYADPLEEQHIGPIPFLHETCRHEAASKHHPVTAATSPTPGIWRRYQSRDNRKGRHAVVISPPSEARHGISHPHAVGTLKASLRGMGRMLVRYPVFDVSYDVAVIFTLGSVIWVVNGFFAWLPVQWPSTEFVGEEGLGAGITAFIGATVFELGSVLLVLEAVNERRTDCFGWALEEAMNSYGLLLRPDPAGCAHHHSVRDSLLTAREAETDRRGDRSWEWWPTWSELKTHYFREIGFLASFAQFVAATVFWISGFTALPSIQGRLSTPAVNGVYWLPQVVGGVGFIISSLLFMIETQTTWYTPALNVLGWHIGFWNLIGSIGFTLCGAAGFSSSEAAVYTSDLSTFIGSWAFLIGSVIQWYESLDKYPVRIQ